MSKQAITEYLIALTSKYQNSTKLEKNRILNDAQELTGYERKYLIKRLSKPAEEIARKKGSGRPFKYAKEELLPHIKHLWINMECISAPRMKAGVADFLRCYEGCPGHLKLQILSMSASTINRYLREIRQSEEVIKGLSTTCPARHMKNKVPINTLDSKIRKPGYTQTDTVAHCGDSAKGPFISSLTVTDIYTTWTENRAIFTKRGAEVKKQFSEIEKALPFRLIAINSDSGSEFLNKNMLQFTKYGSRIQFTRSRPYKKNDNCYVEQKNFTHVRELFGYERLEDAELVPLMNDIYKIWNDYQNFFMPTFKLKEKIRIGSRVKKKYDLPKTPYQRLLNSDVLTEQEQTQLRDKKLNLNPFELKKNLEMKLQEFFELVRKKNIRKVA